MTIRKRLAALESRQSLPPTTELTGSAAEVRELDKLIARHEAHIHELEQNPGAYEEGYDLDLYDGETFKEHEARVDELMRRSHERHKEWCKVHRPDLVGVPNEIEDHIAELNQEIALLEIEIRSLDTDNEGGGG